MKTQTNVEISEQCSELHAALERIEKSQVHATECKNDLLGLEAQLKQLGVPSYKDEKAVEKLLAVRQKISLCEAEIKHHDQLVEGATETLYSRLQGAANCVEQLILRPVHERRLDTISAVLRPFSDSDEKARELAGQTAACMTSWRTLGNVGRVLPPQHALKNARVLLTIMKEAQKNDGDLIQFLDPSRLSELYA